MSLIKEAEKPADFMSAIKSRSLNQVEDTGALADKLNIYYQGYDNRARREYVRSVITMYANYENKYYGQPDDITGVWQPDTMLGTEVAFSVPLLKAHVDTGVTFYCKAAPEYKAVQRVEDFRLESLARMCEKIGMREYRRMFTSQFLQREAQYMFLAGRSFRQIGYAVCDESPRVVKFDKTTTTKSTDVSTCKDCGYSEESEMSVCPTCLSEKVDTSKQDIPKTSIKAKTIELPRPTVSIPNPISMQTDFSSVNVKESGFIVRRRLISRQAAEYFYQVDLENSYPPGSYEAQVLERLSKEPLTGDTTAFGAAAEQFGIYFNSQTQKVQEQEFWLEPQEYALYVVKGKLLGQDYPDGLYIHLVGDKLVDMRNIKKNRTWVGLTCGLRPSSSTGFGMMHLAEMNDLINNAINLEYSVLRTAGFPITLLRSRYLKELPEALQTVLLDNLPDDVPLEDVMTRIPPANASGMLGILSQKFEGYMQFAGATWSAVGGAPDVQAMGTATGVAAMQEMMSDRLGLAVQMRIDADIESLYAILELMQDDKSSDNRDFLLKEFDEETVELFFGCNLRSLFQFEAVKGTEEPQMESVNTFKAQTFAQLTASMAGMFEYDKGSYYDILSMFGDSMNLNISIGKGRKEKNVADTNISRIQNMARTEQQGNSMQDEQTLALKLFKDIIEQDAVLSMLDPSIEIYLYDYDALIESYSDWLQSPQGANEHGAVRTAVGLLYAYCLKMKDKRQDTDDAKELQRQAKAQVAAAGIQQMTQPPGAQPPPTLQVDGSGDNPAPSDQQGGAPQGAQDQSGGQAPPPELPPGEPQEAAPDSEGPADTSSESPEAGAEAVNPQGGSQFTIG